MICLHNIVHPAFYYQMQLFVAFLVRMPISTSGLTGSKHSSLIFQFSRSDKPYFHASDIFMKCFYLTDLFCRWLGLAVHSITLQTKRNASIDASQWFDLNPCTHIYFGFHSNGIFRWIIQDWNSYISRQLEKCLTTPHLLHTSFPHMRCISSSMAALHVPRIQFTWIRFNCICRLWLRNWLVEEASSLIPSYFSHNFTTRKCYLVSEKYRISRVPFLGNPPWVRPTLGAFY